MTDEELSRRASEVSSAIVHARTFDDSHTDNDLGEAREAVGQFVAEIRRLRGLIAQIEPYGCPWCRMAAPHKDDCPAFTPDGKVK